MEGQEYTLDAAMLEFVQSDVRINGENIVPGVIEPSFGIGRIIYAILEHAYQVRPGEEEEKRAVRGKKKKKRKIPPPN